MTHDEFLVFLSAMLTVIIALVSLIGGWLIKETQKNTLAMTALTTEMHFTREEMKFFRQEVVKISKIERDIYQLQTLKIAAAKR